MKSFRLHRPKKGFQAIYKRKLTWKEKIKKFIFVPLFIVISLLIVALITYLAPVYDGLSVEDEPTPAEKLRNLVEFIKYFFE
tara:strand:- start:192 stop:437 length:246 start_codon:yes stop_codon:yes gene_type:complete